MFLIGNGRLFTRDTECPYIECGGILVDGNLIKEIGHFDVLKEKYPTAEVIDANNQIIMPIAIQQT